MGWAGEWRGGRWLTRVGLGWGHERGSEGRAEWKGEVGRGQALI